MSKLPHPTSPSPTQIDFSIRGCTKLLSLKTLSGNNALPQSNCNINNSFVCQLGSKVGEEGAWYIVGTLKPMSFTFPQPTLNSHKAAQ